MALPSEYTFGKVVTRIVQSVADGSDPDRFPDMLAAGGTITFKPKEKNRKTHNYSALVLNQNIKGTLYVPDPNLPKEHYAYPPGTLLDSQGNEGVWLVTGNYTAEFQLYEGSFPPLEFTLSDDDDADTPLDLIHASPTEPPQGVIMVQADIPPGGRPNQTIVTDENGQLAWRDFFDEEFRSEFISYRDQSKEYSEDSKAARTGARTSETNAKASETAADGHADRAELAAFNSPVIEVSDTPPEPNGHNGVWYDFNPGAVTYAWADERYNSESIKYVDDVEVARNRYPNPRFKSGLGSAIEYSNAGNTGTLSFQDDGVHISSSLDSEGRYGLRYNRLNKDVGSNSYAHVELTTNLHEGHRARVHIDQTLEGSWVGSSSRDIDINGRHTLEFPLREDADGISIAFVWLERLAGEGTTAGESSVIVHNYSILPEGVEPFDGDSIGYAVADTQVLHEGYVTQIRNSQTPVISVSNTPPEVPDGGGIWYDFKPGAVTYGWEGAQYDSDSIKYIDGVEVARNRYPNPEYKLTIHGELPGRVFGYSNAGNTGTYDFTDEGVVVTSNIDNPGRFGMRANGLSKGPTDVAYVDITVDLAPKHQVNIYIDQTLDGSFNSTSSSVITTNGRHNVRVPLRPQTDGISAAFIWIDRPQDSEPGESKMTIHSYHIVPEGHEPFTGDTRGLAFADTTVLYEGSNTLVQEPERPVTPQAIQEISQGLGLREDTSVGTRIFLGDTMIYGDTGVRNILDRVRQDEFFTFSEDNPPTIRRENSTVTLEMTFTALEGVSSGTYLLGLPSGWAAGRNLHLGLDVDGGRTAFRFTRDGYDLRTNTGLLRGTEMSLSFTWTTPQSWPTSLIGVRGPL